MTHGQQGQFHVTTDFQFIKYTVTVTVDRFRAQAELVGDFLNLLTVHDHHGNLHFTLGQPFKNVFVRFRLIGTQRSEEHTSELQSRENLVCRLLLEKKNTTENNHSSSIV